MANKKLRRMTAALTIITLSLFAVTGCQINRSAAVINIGVLKGPTGIAAVRLMEQYELGNIEGNYKFHIFSTPDEVNAKIISGELDIAAVPTNAAAVLYNRTNGGIQVAAVHTLGTIYIIENGNTIKTLADLKGKKIAVSGQGATPEYALKYILTANGFDLTKDMQIEFKSEHAELATLLTAGTVSIGLLPEPNVTAVLMNNENARIALNMTDEWAKAAKLTNAEGSELTTGVMIVNKDFAQKNKAAFDKFLSDYEQSILYVNSNVAEAAALCEKFGIIPKAAIAERAIPNCSITYIEGNEMKAAVQGYLATLFGFNPQSVGGNMPDDEFYYSK